MKVVGVCFLPSIPSFAIFPGTLGALGEKSLCGSLAKADLAAAEGEQEDDTQEYFDFLGVLGGKVSLRWSFLLEVWVCLATTGEAVDAETKFSEFVWLVSVPWLFTQVNRDFLWGDKAVWIFGEESALSLTFDVGIEEVGVGESLVAIITVLLLETVLVRYEFTWGSAVCFLLKALDSSDEETNEVAKQLIFDAAFCLIFPSSPLCCPHFVVHKADSAMDSVLVLVDFKLVLSSPSALTLLLPIEDAFTQEDVTVLVLLTPSCRTLLTPAREKASDATPLNCPVLFRFTSEICEVLPSGALVVLLLREYFFFHWLEEWGAYGCAWCEYEGQ